MEQGTQDDEGRLTQLADFWFFEHLLSLPKSVVDDEMVYHLGSMFPYREVESASLPAPVSARLFLRRMRNQPQPIADWDEQFQMLGLMCQLSCKREQFRSREMAAAINPPSELIIEVLMQLLCARADPAYSEVHEAGEQPLTSADVAPTAHALLDNADVGYLSDDEQLQNRLSLLEQLLRGGLEAVQLQQHLRQAFPADAVEEQLRDYADKAWTMLGQTTLQRYQAEVMAGRLPFDPMQHFATLLPVATQAVFGDADAAAVAAAAANVGAASASPLQQQQQQQPRARGARPVPLLGEATAPVVGTEELEGLPAPGSSPGKRAGRGGRQQQAAAAAAAATGASPQPKASPMPKASPQQAKPSPAAAAAAGGDDVGKPGRRHRKEVAAGAPPTRKQLDLQKSTAAAGAAAAAAAADEDVTAEAATDAAAAADSAKKGRKSRKQQLADSDFISSEPASAAAGGDENMPPPAAAVAAAGSGGRKRGRKLSPAKATAVAAAAAGGSEEQLLDSSQPNVVDGVEPASGPSQEAAAAAGNGKPKGLGSAFQSFLNRPLDSLAAAAGGLAAVVRGSPVRTLPKERKICGAPQEGVKGRTVPWESPFGGSIDSPEESPRGKAAKSPAAAGGGAAAAAAAGAGRPAVDALKRKRAHADGQKGPLAAARGAAAAAAKPPDSNNTEYQDAREDAGSDSDAAPVRRSPRQHKKPRREVHDESDGDSSIDDPESEKGDDSQGDEFEYDAESEEEGGRQQQQQKRRPGRPKQQQVGRKPGRPPGRAGGASGGAAARAAAGFDPDFDLLDERGGTKKRRRFQRWTAEEEALLIQLVAAEGEGAWAAILKLGGQGFNRRTQVDLKDKWRNLKKKGAVSD